MQEAPRPEAEFKTYAQIVAEAVTPEGGKIVVLSREVDKQIIVNGPDGQVFVIADASTPLEDRQQMTANITQLFEQAAKFKSMAPPGPQPLAGKPTKPPKAPLRSLNRAERRQRAKTWRTQLRKIK